MLSATLIKREIKANYKLTLIFMAVLSMYAGMIIAMYDPKLGDSLKMMAESMPQLFAAFGMLNVGSSLLEFVANYLYGFLLIAFPLVYITMLTNRLMTRYIDKGSMAYLLATPNKHVKIALTQAANLLLGLCVLVLYVAALGIALCEAMFPAQLDITKFIVINAGLLGLLVLFAGIPFCAACVFQDAKYAMGFGVGLPVCFVLIQMIGQVGDKFTFLQYLTPITLFDIDRLVAGEAQGVYQFLLLYAAGLLFFGVGIAIFSKKDLSL